MTVKPVTCTWGQSRVIQSVHIDAVRETARVDEGGRGPGAYQRQRLFHYQVLGILTSAD
jgi:hypothetical protein